MLRYHDSNARTLLIGEEEWGAGGGGSGGIVTTAPCFQLDCNALGAELSGVPARIRLGLEPLPQAAFDQKAAATAVFVRAATPTASSSSPPSGTGGGDDGSSGPAVASASCNAAGAGAAAADTATTNNDEIGENTVQPTVVVSPPKAPTDVAGAGGMPTNVGAETGAGTGGKEEAEADSEQEDLEDWLDSVL